MACILDQALFKVIYLYQLSFIFTTVLLLSPFDTGGN